MADVQSPVTGRVVEVNSSLDDAPEQINQDCYGVGWMAKIELTDPCETRSLLKAEEYHQLVQRLLEQKGG